MRCGPGIYLRRCDIENIRLSLYDPHRQMRKGEEQLWVHLGAVGGRWNVPQFFMVQRGNKNRIVRTYGQVFQEVVFGKRSDIFSSKQRRGKVAIVVSLACDVLFVSIGVPYG